ncbi:IclR family transcriptional regulator [Bradyrhizobium sp. WSM1417]|uniref:IclR family transcriptional regulator n=1 Tax=Bradyrhizobium sp. WSM1417 TaxID=754500 RepID=UPI00048A3265|nr:IclR family transcriptional regulator [Bradyrhizobium sp. WSM1417]
MSNDENSPGPLGRYIDVLEVIAAFAGTITLADVASILDLPKTTAHRLLKGLVRSGLATEGEAGRTYHIGERLTRLLHAGADDGWYASMAGQHVRALTEASAETCYLARLVGSRVTVAVSYSPDVRWRGYVRPGIEMPVNAAATGKAIMAFQSKELISEALSNSLPKPTSKSHTSRKWIEQEFAKVRKLGYATCIGEIDEGLAALAVPVTLEDGTVLQSVGMTGPLERIMNRQLDDRLAALRETATALSKTLSRGLAVRNRN